MKKKRRDFIRITGFTGIGMAGGLFDVMAKEGRVPDFDQYSSRMEKIQTNSGELSVIGQYGPWAAGLTERELPSLSFRRDSFSNIDQWRGSARGRVMERLAVPDIGGMPAVTKLKEYSYDGLHIEELSWQLPYGRPTIAMLLKPEKSSGRLPGILAFHDHGGNKYLGTRKITRNSDQPDQIIVSHQKEYYEGRAWANEIAKRGYVVLVSDAFTFASRRVYFEDVPMFMRNGHNDQDPENPAHIHAYNDWAGLHEHVMAKSLFCAGTTWPAVFFAEDRKALDILAARPDVDPERIGCAGLSGGGLRTVFMGGLDPRIRCAITVGFMSTWRDFLLNKSVNHTWMLYVPLLPRELDFPEILGLRAPLATMVLNDEQDDLYTLPEMRRADAILAEVYKKSGAPERYKCSYYPGLHKFDQKMQEEAFDWFDRWLKG